MRILLPFYFAAAILVSSGTARANLIENGSFEITDSNGSLVGWTARSVDIAVGWDAQHGNTLVDLNRLRAGYVRQNFETILGQEYLLSFYMSANPEDGPGPKSLTAGVWEDGLVVNLVSAQFSFDASGTPFDLNWVQHTLGFTGTGSTLTLIFEGDRGAGAFGPLIDNVDVVAGSAVPEPSSIMLLGGGLAAVGVLARKRKR